MYNEAEGTIMQKTVTSQDKQLHDSTISFYTEILNESMAI